MLNKLQRKQKQEACYRLLKMKSPKECFLRFKIDGNISFSRFEGHITDLPFEIKQFVNSFESEHNARVYHVFESHSNFGTILNLLFVSDNETKWETEFRTINSEQNYYFTIGLMKFLDNDYRSRTQMIPVRLSEISKSFKWLNTLDKPSIAFDSKIHQKPLVC